MDQYGDERKEEAQNDQQQPAHRILLRFRSPLLTYLAMFGSTQEGTGVFTSGLRRPENDFPAGSSGHSDRRRRGICPAPALVGRDRGADRVGAQPSVPPVTGR